MTAGEPSARGGGAAAWARLVLAAVLGALFLASVALLIEIAANRPFQVDEVEHVHATYELRAGRLIYRDFRQAHDPLLYPLLEPLVDPADPVASFHRARIPSTAMLLATIVLVGWCAFRLSNALGGLLASGLALTHSTLIERGMEVRPDGPLALCIAAALAVELSGLEKRRRFLLEGLILSAAFLFTNKAAFACFAFGCLWLASAVRERSPGLVVWSMVAWTAPLAVAAGVMAWLGNLDAFLRLNVLNAASEAVGAAAHTTRFGPWQFLWHEGARNLLFSVLAVAGLLYGAGAWLPRSSPAAARRPAAWPAGAKLRFTAFLGAILVASLWLNPFPFPYLHVTVLPTLAVLAGAAVARLVAARGLTAARAGGLGLLVGLVAVSFFLSFPRLVELATRSQDHQMQTLQLIQRLTEPGDPVFDMVGLYFRPDGHYAYLMTGNTFSRYRSGGLRPIPEELRRTGTVALIFNYRTTWLGSEDRHFLETHFVQYDRNVFLLGIGLTRLQPGEEVRFEALAGKRFRYDGPGQIAVDGQPFKEGFLARGEHTIERLAGRGPSRLIMATSSACPWPPRPPRPLFLNFD